MQCSHTSYPLALNGHFLRRCACCRSPCATNITSSLPVLCSCASWVTQIAKQGHCYLLLCSFYILVPLFLLNFSSRTLSCVTSTQLSLPSALWASSNLKYSGVRPKSIWNVKATDPRKFPQPMQKSPVLRLSFKFSIRRLFISSNLKSGREKQVLAFCPTSPISFLSFQLNPSHWCNSGIRRAKQKPSLDLHIEIFKKNNLKSSC